jgi:hypothetical protein
MFTLIGADGRPYPSTVPGILGGYRRRRIYGRLDCPSALRAIAGGGYIRHRVFFADEETARAAGYRPCAVCLPETYARWQCADQDWATPPESLECSRSCGSSFGGKGGGAEFQTR